MICYNCSSEAIKYDKATDAYRCLNCGHIYPKEYWFISHSHLDIEKVRIIRDVIEEVFFYEPILFFLKCLDDDCEISNLIQREIAERIWFVYCRSENAEKSKYVQEERAYLDDLIARGKRINKIQIELDKFELWEHGCKEYIREQVFRGIRKTKLFLSYARSDGDVVTAVYDRLTGNGYNAQFLIDPIHAADNFGFSVKSAIEAHSYADGAVLAFVTDKALNSQHFISELAYAHSRSAVIIPVFINDGSQVKEMRERLLKLLPQLSKSNYVVYDVQDPYGSYNKLEQALKFFYIK